MDGVRSQHGVTLIELLLVIVCLGIAAMLAVPLVSGAQQDQLRGAASMLAADLDYARAASITHASDPCVVVFDLDVNAWHLARASDPDEPILNPATRQDYRTQLGQGRAGHLGAVTIVDVDGGGSQDTVTFNAFGAVASDQDVTITLGGGTGTMVLSIAGASGEVTVDKGP